MFLLALSDAVYQTQVANQFKPREIIQIKNLKHLERATAKHSSSTLIVDKTFFLSRSLGFRETVLQLRMRHPELRIIFLFQKREQHNKIWLYHWHVFDTFDCTPSVAELMHNIQHPKTFRDIHIHYVDFEPLATEILEEFRFLEESEHFREKFFTASEYYFVIYQFSFDLRIKIPYVGDNYIDQFSYGFEHAPESELPDWFLELVNTVHEKFLHLHRLRQLLHP